MPILDTDEPGEISDTVILQLTGAPAGQPAYTIGSPSNAVVTIVELIIGTGNLPPVGADRLPQERVLVSRPRNHRPGGQGQRSGRDRG